MSEGKDMMCNSLNRYRIEKMAEGKDVSLVWECIDKVLQEPSAQAEHSGGVYTDGYIEQSPSAQPEQQIRCNECIYFDKYTDGIEKYQWDGFCSVWARNANEEWYCSRAERRTDG